MFNRSPEHHQVVGASLFPRAVADMRDRAVRGRVLHVRGGESARALAAARSLSPGPDLAESGEREAAAW
jgi:hypothetical protein